MAQTKRKRRRKHRGTQGGRVDDRPRGRPKSRAEARQRAKSRGGSRQRGGDRAQGRVVAPPTWKSAIQKGLIAGVLFFGLMALAFKRPISEAGGIAVAMLAFYIPMAYLADRFFYGRELRKREQERLAKQHGDA